MLQVDLQFRVEDLEVWGTGGQKPRSDMSAMDHKRRSKGLTARRVRPHGYETMEDPTGDQHGSSAESLRVEMNRFHIHGLKVKGNKAPSQVFSGQDG